MPVVGKTVFAAVLAHGRNHDAVPEGDISNGEGSEQHSGKVKESGLERGSYDCIKKDTEISVSFLNMIAEIINPYSRNRASGSGRHQHKLT